MKSLVDINSRNALVVRAMTHPYNKLEFQLSSYTSDRLFSGFGNNSLGYDWQEATEVIIQDPESTITMVASLTARLKLVR